MTPQTEYVIGLEPGLSLRTSDAAEAESYARSGKRVTARTGGA